MLSDIFIVLIAVATLIIVILILAWFYLREPEDAKQEFSREIEKAVDTRDLSRLPDYPQFVTGMDFYNAQHYDIDPVEWAQARAQQIAVSQGESPYDQEVIPADTVPENEEFSRESEKAVDTTPIGNMTVEQILETDWSERLEYDRMLFRATYPRYYKNTYYRQWRKELSLKAVQFAQDRMAWRLEMGLSAT
jgi:hypothetical protein